MGQPETFRNQLDAEETKRAGDPKPDNANGKITAGDLSSYGRTIGICRKAIVEDALQQMLEPEMDEASATKQRRAQWAGSGTGLPNTTKRW